MIQKLKFINVSSIVISTKKSCLFLCEIFLNDACSKKTYLDRMWKINMMETHDEVGKVFWIKVWCLIRSSKNGIGRKEQRELETKVGMTKEDFVAMWANVIFKTNNFWGIYKRLKLKDREKVIESLAI